MKSKVFALITAAALVITAACGASPAETPEPAQPVGSASSEKDYSEHYVISYAMDTTNLDVNSDDFAKYWNEKFNIEYEIVPLTSENSSEMIRIWVSAGDLPDVARWGFNFSEYTDWVDQGLLKELPDGWQTQWPNIAQSQVDTTIAAELAERVGGYFTLGRPIYSTNKPIPALISHMGLWYRMDWAKAVGAEIKDWYTIDEVLEIARRIKAQDPGGVGDALVPIDVPTGNLPEIFMANALHYGTSPPSLPFYQDENGVFQWGLEEPAVLDGLKRWRAAYDEGLLHPEFYTLPVGRANEADLNTAGIAAMNIAAGMATVGSRQANFIRQNLNLDPNEALSYAFMVGDDGVYRAREVSNWGGCDLYSPDIDPGKFERFLDMLDYSCTDEAQILIRMGFEDIDWERLPDGSAVSLLPEDSQVAQKYFSVQPLYTGMLVMPDNFQLVNPTLPQIWRDKARNQYLQKIELTNEENFARIDPDVYFYSSEAWNRAQMNFSEEMASIVLKGTDVEAAYNAWVAEKKPLVQPLLDELTEMKKNQ
ncbi:MAG: extracellular solute-binding protein [Clostridiales bacterium]|jgi:putative aldouronate transport system substrate-binding protein|nr:extracellular solute-binding protein [Clostridiales bacterium]